MPMANIHSVFRCLLLFISVFRCFGVFRYFYEPPNLGGTFRLGKNPTSLTLIKVHCVESEIILFSYFYIERAYHCMCTSTGLSLRLYCGLCSEAKH